MLKVKVKGPAIKLASVWKFKGEIAFITQEEYKENEQYLELLEGSIEKPNENTKSENSQGNGSEDNVDDKELELLRERAKDLGIRNAYKMKKENLISKIEEVEKADSSESDEDRQEKDDGEQPEEQ